LPPVSFIPNGTDHMRYFNPNWTALECYFNLRDGDELLRGRQADLQLNANGGNKTIHCSPEFPYCITLHCQKDYGKFCSPVHFL
jgi:hypothetical protein